MKQIYKIKDAVSNDDIDVEFDSQEDFERYLNGEQPILENVIGTNNCYKASFLTPTVEEENKEV